jgi:hypothetical protein
MLLIFCVVKTALAFATKMEEKESTKPESKSLEEKDTPHSGSTKIYRREVNKAEPETPEPKCMCHRPLELDNAQVL